MEIEKKTSAKKNNKNSDRQKNENNKKLLLVIVAIIIVVIIVFLSSFIGNDHLDSNYKTRVTVDTPLIYLNDDKQLKYCTFANQIPKVNLGGVDLGDSLYLYQTNDKKKYNFSTVDSLYLLDENNVDSAMKLVNGYSSYKRNNDYFVYTLENDLYVLDINENIKDKIDSNINKITNISEKYYTYIKDGYEFLMSFEDKSLKIKLGKLDKDEEEMYSNIIDISDKYDKVLYESLNNENNYDLVVHDIKNNKSNVISDWLYSVSYYSDDFSKIGYITIDERKHASLKMISYNTNIDELINRLFQEQDYITYYQSICGDNYCYYVELSDDNYRKVEFTQNEYFEISKYLELFNSDENYYSNTYNAYFYEDGNNESLIEGVDYVKIYKNKDISYSKFSGQKININKFIKSLCGDDCFESLHDIDNTLKYDIYYKKYNKKENLIEANSNASSAIVSIGGLKVLSIYNSPNRSYYLLKDDGDIIKKSDLIVNNGISCEEQLQNSDDGILFYENYNYEKQVGDLYLYKNGEKIHIADEIYIYSLIIKGNNVFFVENFDFDQYAGTFSKYNIKDKKKTKIVDNINRGFYVADDKYFIMKNYSMTNNTFDLYSYSNEKLKMIEYSVKAMNWANFLN